MKAAGARRDLAAAIALAAALHLAALLLLGGARTADTPPRLDQPATTRVTIQLPAARPPAAPATPAAAPVQPALPRPEPPPPSDMAIPDPMPRPLAPRPAGASTPRPASMPETAPSDAALVEIATPHRTSTFDLPLAAPLAQMDLDGDHDVAPRPRQAIRPVYPYGARQRGESGRVVLEVRISAEGRVETVHFAASSGYEALDHAAREAVRAARFEPARRGAEPVASRVRMTIIFQLKEARREM